MGGKNQLHYISTEILTLPGPFQAAIGNLDFKSFKLSLVIYLSMEVVHLPLFKVWPIIGEVKGSKFGVEILGGGFCRTCLTEVGP